MTARIEKIALTPGQVAELPIRNLRPDPDQPRKSFDDSGIDQLADSIVRRGIQVPLLVRPGKGARYVIHDGERRWRAAKRAKLRTLPVLLVEGSGGDEDLRTAQLTVNNLREQLKPMEVARLLADLQRKHFASGNELAAHLEAQGLPAMTPKQLRETIELVDLPDWAQAMIDAGHMEPSSAAKLRIAMPYPKVMEAVQKRLKQHIDWSGRIKHEDLVNSLRWNFHQAGVDLNRTDEWYVGRPGAVHFNPKVACKGCEHLINISGSKICMNAAEFERKNAEAKAAGLLPGGKKPKKPSAAPEDAAEREAEAKQEKRAKSLHEKVRDYLHAYLVDRIVRHMERRAERWQLDVTDELLAWRGLEHPGGEEWRYDRPAYRMRDELAAARAAAGVKCLEDLFRADGDEIEKAKLQSAIQVARTLAWRETQVVCHHLWGASVVNVWSMDESFLQLFRKAELLRLVEQHALELDEGRDWTKLKLAELRQEILQRKGMGTLASPAILQDLYADVAAPYVPWNERPDEEDLSDDEPEDVCHHGVGFDEDCEACEQELVPEEG